MECVCSHTVSKVGLGSQLPGVKGDRDLVARKRGNDARLVAEAKQPVRIGEAGFVHEPVRDPEDRQGPLQESVGPIEANCQMRAGFEQVSEERAPAPADPREQVASGEKAKVRGAPFDELQARVAALEHDDLDRAVEATALGWLQAEVALE